MMLSPRDGCRQEQGEGEKKASKRGEIERGTHTHRARPGSKVPPGYFLCFLGNAPRFHSLPCLATCPLFLKVGNCPKCKCRAGILRYQGCCHPASQPPPLALDHRHQWEAFGWCPSHLWDSRWILHGQTLQLGSKHTTGQAQCKSHTQPGNWPPARPAPQDKPDPTGPVKDPSGSRARV